MQFRRDKYHSLWIDGMDGTDGFVIHPIERRLIMVELIRGSYIRSKPSNGEL